MRTRDKIWIFLFAVTVLLGGVILIVWASDVDTLLQFRRLLFSHPMILLRDGILDYVGPANLFYGGITLVAFIMFALLLRSVRGGEIQAFKERLVSAEVTKAELETFLQDAVWKEKHALQGKDAAIKDLQSSMSTLLAVERQLAESEKLLRMRDAELKALNAKLDSVTNPAADIASANLWQQPALQDELNKKTALLEDKDRVLKQLEKDLTGRLQALQTKLDAQDELLNARDKELGAIREQLAEKTAPNHAENFLATQLRKAQLALQTKDSAMQEIERDLTAKLRVLEIQLGEKQDLLQNRNTEINALRADLKRLTGQLAEMALAVEQSENALQETLKAKTEELQSKDSAVKELEKEWVSKAHALETQLLEERELRRRQDGELETLRCEMITMAAQQADIVAVKDEAEKTLQREINSQRQLTLEKDARLKELQEQYFNIVGALKAQLAEKEALLQEHNAELESLRSKLNTLAAAGNAKTEAEKALQQELKKQMQALQAKDTAVKQLEDLLSKQALALQSQLTDKDKLLKERDGEMESLRSKVDNLMETLSINERTESLLRNDLKKEQRALRAKESAIKELEHNLNVKLRALENEANEKQKLLQTRSAESEAFKAEVNRLTARLAEVASAVKRSENAHQQELKKKTEALESKEAAIKELEKTLSVQINTLTNKLEGKDTLLKERGGELDALRAQLIQTGSAKSETEGLLRQQLSKTMEALEAKESTIKELEKSLNKTLAALENQASEQDTLLQSRNEEIEKLRSEVAALRSQPVKPDSATERAESLLYEKLLKEHLSNFNELDESLTIAQGLEIVLKEKEDLINTRDAKIERLEAELQDKRKELAKHEISVWQSIERRELWKHRLAKLGITLKD
jgi:chromosome segregation ATPase